MNERALFKIGAAGGLIFVILQMVSQGMIQIGGAEPAFKASSEEIIRFFSARNLVLANLGAYISLLSFLPFIWFLGVLRATLRAGAEAFGWIADVAFASGLMAVVPSVVGGWGLAIFRLGEGLDPEIAQLTFDLGNLGFANTWMLLGGMLLAVGVAVLSTGVLRTWLGWYSLIVAVGLLAARAVWLNQIAFAPYVLYWLWLIIVSVMLVRDPGDEAIPSRQTG
jgi:hypothetical protein